MNLDKSKWSKIKDNYIRRIWKPKKEQQPLFPRIPPYIPEWGEPIRVPREPSKIFQCLVCEKIVSGARDFVYCPYCGSLLEELVTVEQIKALLEELNRKIQRYLARKATKKEGETK